MITGTGMRSGGSVAEGVRKDVSAKAALKRRQEKRRIIEDANDLAALIGLTTVHDKDGD